MEKTQERLMKEIIFQMNFQKWIGLVHVEMKGVNGKVQGVL